MFRIVLSRFSPLSCFSPFCAIHRRGRGVRENSREKEIISSRISQLVQILRRINGNVIANKLYRAGRAKHIVVRYTNVTIYCKFNRGHAEFPFKLHFCAVRKCARCTQTQLINSDNQSDSLHRETDIGHGDFAISIYRITLRWQKLMRRHASRDRHYVATHRQPIQRVKAQNIAIADSEK